MARKRASSTDDGGAKQAGGGNSLSIAAYDLIRANIQEGRYGPGDRVLEDEIAKALNSSRTPVRDAMRRLEAEGFLVHESHRGMVIPKLDHQTVMELYGMWIVFEAAAAGLAARHASDAELDLLDEMVERSMREATTPEEMADHNRRFHQTLYKSAHNRYLLKSVGVLMDSLNILSKTTFTVGDRLKQAQIEHKAIVDGIRSRKTEKAEAASRAHTAASLKARLILLAESDE